jgi:aminodeoxyfutalosine deaminase
MFGTDLSRDYDAAAKLGLDPQMMFAAGLEGALCDDEARSRLVQIGEEFDWAGLAKAESPVP